MREEIKNILDKYAFSDRSSITVQSGRFATPSDWIKLSNQATDQILSLMEQRLVSKGEIRRILLQADSPVDALDKRIRAKFKGGI